MRPKLSVIIPIYGVENSIEKCAESLFRQTLDDIEYIFVNDCTPDRSIHVLHSVIDRYPDRRNQIRIINLSVNSRQAAARNAGLKQAEGEYIIHCDPDDWIDPMLYEDMYSLASKHGYDIVSCDYLVESKDNSQSLIVLPSVNTPMDVLYSNHYYIFTLWSHMVRRSIITDNSIKFFAGINCSEDVGFMARVFAISKTIGHNPHKSYYHYIKNEQSITSRLNSPEIIDQRIRCLNLIDHFMASHGLDATRLAMLQRLKRDIKNIYLKKESLDRWVKLFPEVCSWECRQPEASLIYKITYFLSHKIGIWPMKLLLSLSHQ